MNRRSFRSIIAPCLVLICLLAMMAHSPAHARKGTVKTLIGWDGFVHLNTDDQGEISVLIRIKKGEPNRTFEVGIQFESGEVISVGSLETNRKGNAAKEFREDLPSDPDPDGDGSINVTVHLDSMSSDPVRVPLKG